MHSVLYNAHKFYIMMFCLSTTILQMIQNITAMKWSYYAFYNYRFHLRLYWCYYRQNVSTIYPLVITEVHWLADMDLYLLLWYFVPVTSVNLRSYWIEAWLPDQRFENMMALNVRNTTPPSQNHFIFSQMPLILVQYGVFVQLCII